MSEQTPELPVNNGQQNSGENQEPPNLGGNPAWDDFLNPLPKEFHPQVLPVLQKWDSGVQNKLQEVHSQYAPFKDFLENKIDPADLQQGYGVLQAIKDDPESVYKALAQAYGYGATGQQGETEVEEETDTTDLPPHVVKKLEEMEGQLSNMARILVHQQEQETEAQEYNKLEQELAGLRKEHGNFDERFVLALMQNQVPAADAVKEYFNLVNDIKTQNNRPPIPKILSPGSAIPESGGIDPRKLDSKQTRSLVEDMLKASLHNQP